MSGRPDPRSQPRRTQRGPGHRRLVLELGQTGADAAAIRIAAEFALGLGLDLHGVFIEDPALVRLAELPFAREIRWPSQGWHRIDADRMQQELHQAAAAAHRRLERAVAALGLPIGFEVLQGDLHTCIAGACHPTDIVVVVDPGSGTLTDWSGLQRAAEDSSASMLLVPRHAVHRHGPVAVVAVGMADPGIGVASGIAAAQDAKLCVIVPPGDSDPAERPAWLPEDTRVVTAPGSSADSVLRALSGEHERLVVLTADGSRAAGPNSASRLAASRRIPVLVL